MTNFARSIVALTLALAFNAHADNSASDAARAGSEAARQVLTDATPAAYNATGGRNQAGSFQIGDQVFEIGELMPGATRSDMEREQGRRVNEASELTNEGIDAFNRAAKEDSAIGEAARALLDNALAPANPQAANMDWLLGSAVVKDALSEAFADCQSTADIQDGEPIPATLYTGASCIQVPADYAGASACGRHYEFSIVKVDEPEGSDPGEGDEDGEEAPACDTVEQQLDPTMCPQYELKATMVWGECEAQAASASCKVEWQCTNPGPLVIGGHVVTGEKLEALGIPELFPGGGTCLAAEARMSCPVCIETEGGLVQCTNVDPAQREPLTCQGPNPRSNPSCVAQGTSCFLYDDDTGKCALETVRYACGTETLIPTQRVEVGNTCQAQIQCVDGSCNAASDLDDGEGMSMQQAMARLAVTEMMVTDMAYDAEALAGNGSGQLTPEQQRAIDQIQMFKGENLTCQKGYAGLVDCCGEINTNAEELYWSIYQRVMRDRQANEMHAQGGGQSGYTQWQTGNADYSSLSNPFTSLRDNVTGGGNRSPEAVTMTIWDEFLARAREEIKPSMSPSWACKESEFDLAVQREVDMCSYAGTYCSQRVLGACLKRRESYCCYNSPMSKALRASAEPGGVLRHGDAKNPDCSGLGIDELDKVRWEAIDFTRLAGQMSEGGAFDRATDSGNASANYTGGGQSGSMGQGRQDVVSRSAERLGTVDGSGTSRSIAEDIRSREWRQQAAVQSEPARLSFRTSSWLGRTGTAIVVPVMREGAAGAASATVSVIGGSPETAGFWQETLYWGAGDTTPRSVTLMPPRGSRGEVILEVVAHEGTVAGFDTIRVRIE